MPLSSVLLLEDDESLSEMIQTLLQSELGIRVEVLRESGKVAQVVAQSNPSLVILDAALRHSVSIAKRVKQRFDKPDPLPVLVMVAPGDAVANDLIAICDDHITMPFPIASLLEKVQKYILRQRSASE